VKKKKKMNVYVNAFVGQKDIVVYKKVMKILLNARLKIANVFVNVNANVNLKIISIYVKNAKKLIKINVFVNVLVFIYVLSL
jgi:hypothetical protein